MSNYDENRIHKTLRDASEVIIYCGDCRGKFSVEVGDIVEEEIIECPLCAAEMQVMSEDPVKIQLYNEDDVF